VPAHRFQCEHGSKPTSGPFQRMKTLCAGVSTRKSRRTELSRYDIRTLHKNNKKWGMSPSGQIIYLDVSIYQHPGGGAVFLPMPEGRGFPPRNMVNLARPRISGEFDRTRRHQGSAPDRRPVRRWDPVCGRSGLNWGRPHPRPKRPIRLFILYNVIIIIILMIIPARDRRRASER
jgi:hypothetical protein